MRKPKLTALRRGVDAVFNTQRMEILEARQLLSGVGAATAVGYLPLTTVSSRISQVLTRPVTAAPAKVVASPAPALKTAPAKPTAAASTTATKSASASAGAVPAVTAPSLFPAATYYAIPSSNYSTGRTSTRWFVIHTTEGNAQSAIDKFNTDGVQVSANYQVERNGTIDQFVQNADTAYHSGNSAYNHASIGIEHERYLSGGVQFNATEQEYEASATLIRWLSAYYAIPLQHLAATVAPASPTSGSDIIGHYQVPDPSDSTKGGGANHHTDPVNWDWTHYIDLINTTTTPLMPVLIGPGKIASATLTSVNQTLSWMAAPNAASYKITLKDTTANSTVIYTPAGTATTQAVTLVNGHNYTWSMVSLNGTTTSIASPTYAFSVNAAAALTDAQKQGLMLGMVNTYRGTIPAEMVLAEIMQEGGQGAFYSDGSTKNSFYSTAIQPWCQPTTNTDGIMQTTAASGADKHRPYANTQAGYDGSINDGSTYLKSNFTSYGTLWQASLHYNTGPNSLYIYKGIAAGDKTYLGHIATDLGVVTTLYGIKDPALIAKYNAAQTIVNKYLNNTAILSGQASSYYTTYQTQLDAELKALGAADDAPATPTNTSPASASMNVSLTPTLTASAYSDPNAGDTQSAAQWLIRRVSDGVLVYDTGTDTTHLTSLAVPSGKLVAGVQYSWQARYADTEGLFGSYSTATTFTTVPPPNQAPTIASLALTPGNGYVTQGLPATITPSGVADSDGTVTKVQYFIESNGTRGLQTGTGGDTALATVTTAGYVTAIDTTTLPLGATIFYAVATDNLGATSIAASTATVIAATATSITATPTSGRGATVSWTGGQPDVGGFLIERSTNGTDFTTAGQVAAGVASFDDSGLTPGTAYTYRIRAFSGSSFSTPIVASSLTTYKMGDLDGSGDVNFNDFLTFQNNYGKPGGWAQGDFDNSGDVNFNDFLILQNAMSSH